MNETTSRIFCPRCRRVIKVGKDCPYCGLGASLIKIVHKDGAPVVCFPELHRDTVRRILTNLIINATDDPDGIIKEVAEILADGMFLTLGEATNLVKEIFHKTRQQIIDETWYFDGSHPDVDEAEEMCFTSEIDAFVDNILQNLEKQGKIIFQDTDLRAIVINEDKPLTNFKNLKGLFGNLSGFFWWWDKHHGKDEFLYLDLLDKKKIKEVKILTGSQRVDEKFKKLYKIAKKEFENEGINFELRVLVDKNACGKIHSRFLAHDKGVYLVPPSNIIVDKFDVVQKMEHEAGEMAIKKFNKLWNSAVDISKSWGEIQNARGHKS